MFRETSAPSVFAQHIVTQSMLLPFVGADTWSAPTNDLIGSGAANRSRIPSQPL